METLFDYFWLIAIGINFLNGEIGWVRAQSHIRRNPDLKPGYIKLIRGFVVSMSMPWILMGIGMGTGQVTRLADYFYPQLGNQAVIAWWVSIWALLLFYSYWIWFRNGAEKLVKYPGLMRGNSTNPAMIKLGWSLSLIGAAIAHIILFQFPVKP